MTNELKTEEQIQAENNLDAAIPDQMPAEEIKAIAPIYDNDAAQTGLYGLLSLLPIGLNIIGLPRTAHVWNDNNCKAVSGAFIPVFRKYTWGQKIITFLETGGGMEEIALALTLAPIAMLTYSEFSQESANKKQNQQDAINDSQTQQTQPAQKHEANSPLGSTFKFVGEQ